MRSGLRLGGGWHYEDGLPNSQRPAPQCNQQHLRVLHFRGTRQCDQFNRHGTQVPGTGQYPRV